MLLSELCLCTWSVSNRLQKETPCGAYGGQQKWRLVRTRSFQNRKQKWPEIHPKAHYTVITIKTNITRWRKTKWEESDDTFGTGHVRKKAPTNQELQAKFGTTELKKREPIKSQELTDHMHNTTPQKCVGSWGGCFFQRAILFLYLS